MKKAVSIHSAIAMARPLAKTPAPTLRTRPLYLSASAPLALGMTPLNLIKGAFAPRPNLPHRAR